MKLMLVTDAWFPQVNGVVYTLKNVVNNIKEHEVFILHPEINGAKTLFNLYYNIPILKNPFELVGKYFDEQRPDRVHIATEGSLGVAARRYCLKNKIKFSTSYHTQLADYGWVLYRFPKFITNLYIKWFHSASSKVLVTTKSIQKQLGFKNSIIWGRGVDTSIFNSAEKYTQQESDNTIIFVGRVSKDKNPDNFCSIKGVNKILVGDGPYLESLKARYKDVVYTGFVDHKELIKWYRKAKVFVFPSKHDTFGLVILEAMACGLPVVAYDVPSPCDIVKDGITGYLGDNLSKNVEKALINFETLSKNATEYAKSQSWSSITNQFLSHLTN
jgi:glycosyltransferase involved in cell wall biosynthesis